MIHHAEEPPRLTPSAAVQCMQRGWMCILVGGPATGKTALARSAATLAGRPLLELTLTAGSDTSDFLGSFEQQEPSRRLQVSCCYVGPLARPWSPAVETRMTPLSPS